jgi:hypothetical protein
VSSSPHGPVPRQLARVLANLPEKVRVTWADHQLHGTELPVHGWHRIQGEIHLLVYAPRRESWLLAGCQNGIV